MGGFYHSSTVKCQPTVSANLCLSMPVFLQCKTNIMKSIFLFTVLFFTTFFAQAQADNEQVSVEIISAQVELVEKNQTSNSTVSIIETKNTMEVARLYKSKINIVIKALEFTTKLNSAKLA